MKMAQEMDPEPASESGDPEWSRALEPHLEQAQRDAFVAPRVAASSCLHRLAFFASEQHAEHLESDRQAAGRLLSGSKHKPWP